jgi:hypothetical protein
MKDYNITADNIHNVDKKGFLIGIASKIRRIMSREAYKKGRVRQSVQDRNREFITFITCVCALGNAIPPTLLYKRKSRDL